MAFDPNKPVELTEVDAVFLRNQFNALKALIDAQQATIASLQAQLTSLQSSVNAKFAAVGGIPTNDLIISDPPDVDEVNTLYEKVKSIIADLKN